MASETYASLGLDASEYPDPERLNPQERVARIQELRRRYLAGEILSREETVYRLLLERAQRREHSRRRPQHPSIRQVSN